MTLPASGQISLLDVRNELSQSGQIGLADASVRNLAGISSGQIALSNLWGRSYNPTATVDRTTVTGSATKFGGTQGGAVTATTGSVTCTASGGSGGYTYAWEWVSGATAVVNSPTSASTTFSRSASSSLSGNTVTGVYRCKVTDSSGRVGYSPNVTVQTTHYWDSGM